MDLAEGYLLLGDLENRLNGDGDLEYLSFGDLDCLSLESCLFEFLPGDLETLWWAGDLSFPFPFFLCSIDLLLDMEESDDDDDDEDEDISLRFFPLPLPFCLDLERESELELELE